MKKLLLTLVGVICSLGLWADSQTTLISGVTLPGLPAGTYTVGQTISHNGTNNAVVYDSDTKWAVMQAVVAGYGSPTADNFKWCNAYNGGDGSYSTTGATWDAKKPFVGSTAYTTNTNSHYVNFARRGNVRKTDRTFAYRFTNATSVSAYVKSNGSKVGAGINLAVFKIASDGTQAQVEIKNDYSNAATALTVENLVKTNTYVAYVYGDNNSNGELYEMAFSDASASTETPSFTTNLSTTAYEAVATKEFSLSVVAKDFTSLQWYSCDDAQGTNAKAITGETKATYKFTPAEVGTQYFYCVATNDNATGDKTATSNIATVVASQATTSVVTWKNTNGWGMRSVKAGSAEYKNSGVDIDNGTELTFITDLGAGYSHEWYVNGAKVAATGGVANTNTELAITINGDTNVESRYTPLKKFTFIDNAKAKAYADANGKITLSANNFSYAEGKTVDYWTNGSEKYYVETEYTLTQDVALTPHFVDNTVALGSEETTVTWSFAYKADNTGCPVFTSLQGAGNTINYPVTAVVKGNSIDVNMVIDATATGAKIDNERRLASTNTQVNKGTKITIPAIKGMTIEYTASGALRGAGKTATTIAGSSEYTLSSDSKTATYTYDGDAATIDIVLGDDNTYCASIKVTYPATEFVPAEPADPIVGAGFSMVPTAALSVSKNSSVTLTSENAAITSGTVKFVVTGSSTRPCVESNNRFQINKDSYYEVTLNNALTVGDVLEITTYGSGTSRGFAIRAGASNTTDGQAEITGTKNGTETQSYTVVEGDAFVGENVIYIVTTENSNAAYFTKFEVKSNAAPSIILTTTANMAGYRSFYDAAKSYTTDANTKAYVASEQNAEGKIVLTSIGSKVPADTPVILVTKATAETDGTFKMVLTEADKVDVYEGANLLKVTTADQEVDGYRLGCKDGNIGFYKYATTAPAGIVYLAKPDSAAKLSFIFDENTATGVNAIQSANDVKVRKAIVNGRLVIVTANGTFTPAGAAIK